MPPTAPCGASLGVLTGSHQRQYWKACHNASARWPWVCKAGGIAGTYAAMPTSGSAHSASSLSPSRQANAPGAAPHA